MSCGRSRQFLRDNKDYLAVDLNTIAAAGVALGAIIHPLHEK